MDDLLSEFLTETSESLATLDVELVNLEQNPNDRDILSNIFRLVHTIKGTCGFLGLPRLESLAHAGENVLGKFRDGELEVTPDYVTLIFNSIDRIKDILTHLEENETEPEGDDKDLIAQLNAAAEGQDISSEVEVDEAESTAEQVDDAPSADADDAQSAPVVSDEGFPIAAELLAEVEQAMASGKRAASQSAIEKEMAAELKKEKAAVPKPPVPAAKKEPAKAVATKDEAAGAGPKKEGGASVATQTIRVNVELLENLMTLVSELVLTRNQLLQMVRGSDDSEFSAPLQRLSHITSDLQEGVMKTRMQPIGNAWAKLPRIVRDLGIEMHKKIDLQMYGAETELDRQVLELIKDPLTHMVRNSADHGLENTEERIAIGKPEVGVIKLNAYHEGGHIIIEINDDGRGLNIPRIKEKVIMNGLASEPELESMSDNQIAQFIFKPGFSTAAKVTSVSGRGVGMDVVRTNIEKIGGTIEMKTFTGRGTSFIIKIPLTLAIVSALIVESASERFAIPQISVLELVRVTDTSESGIEIISDAPVLRLRDRLLPLVSLDRILRLEKDTSADETMEDVNASRETFIVVTQVGTYSFGIIVDRVFDTEEIVVKPVAPILRDITMFSGNTILGDGSVIMILDPNGIATATGEVTMGDQHKEKTAAQDLQSSDKTSLLVFRSGGRDLKAVPLALVARLEEIELDKVEYSNGQPVVQYRSQLMPLVHMDGFVQMREEGRQPVLVFSDRDRTMGLVVDEIVDIVEDELDVELKADVPGMIGTAVINNKATDIIDTGYYLTRAFGDWFGGISEEAYGDQKGSKRILLVDDSPFFRNLLTPILGVAGFDVTTADSGADAIALREKGKMFDILITDIEMPEMDGFEFAQAVRAAGEWKNLPLIALSSHATDKDLDRGRNVGFDDYVAKFDRDALLQTLQQFAALTDSSVA
jgi:two-component system chemotaxis sensor kinase CheA